MTKIVAAAFIAGFTAALTVTLAVAALGYYLVAPQLQAAIAGATATVSVTAPRAALAPHVTDTAACPAACRISAAPPPAFRDRPQPAAVVAARQQRAAHRLTNGIIAEPEQVETVAAQVDAAGQQEYWIDNEPGASGRPCLVVRAADGTGGAVATIPPGCRAPGY